ncbi:hypothetical protein B7463_g698, partial [Scytalidium lignicola]
MAADSRFKPKFLGLGLRGAARKKQSNGNENGNLTGNGDTGGEAEERNELTHERSSDSTFTFGRFRFRGKSDDLPQNWWFASTAIPLLAATIGPLANVLSIAALVTKWRDQLPNNGQLPEGTDDAGVGIEDPHWVIVLNAISLACGFIGNLALLFNFTKRVRYIIALPMTIIAWYMATGILISIIVAMNTYVPPVRPGQTYSQGFWYAIIAATLYLVGSMILMINMLGYFLGHYPQHFDLDDDQRTLILQTMMFFFWLAGGAAVFSKVCGYTYADSLYFCDVTVLTVGFGDFVANNTASRALLMPYSVFGIIFLGLMINSIRKFAATMSKDNVVRKHQRHERERTFDRTVTSEMELRNRLGLPPRRSSESRRPSIYASGGRLSFERIGHLDINGRNITFHAQREHHRGGRGGAGNFVRAKALSQEAQLQSQAAGSRKQARHQQRRAKLLLLKEEKDRFDAMREIQKNTTRFKEYGALLMSVLAFSIVWCVGAVVFMEAEKRLQNLSYFEALYFCYVSLLTVGYGDFSPQSNAGKPFFVVWSLIAVPTMTILISDMSDTVIGSINRGTFTLADWTVLPKAGVWHDFLENHPRLKGWLVRKKEESEEKKRIEEGFTIQNPDEPSNAEDPEDQSNPSHTLPTTLSLESLASEPPPNETPHELARKLAIAIKLVANDLRLYPNRRYTYEEWVEFTRLIRFSALNAEEVEEEEEEEGLVEWDWIGEDSPMLADVSESEWVLDRLCESLNRYTRNQAARDKRKNRDSKSRFRQLNFDDEFPCHDEEHDQSEKSMRSPSPGSCPLSPQNELHLKVHSSLGHDPSDQGKEENENRGGSSGGSKSQDESGSERPIIKDRGNGASNQQSEIHGAKDEITEVDSNRKSRALKAFTDKKSDITPLLLAYKNCNQDSGLLVPGGLLPISYGICYLVSAWATVLELLSFGDFQTLSEMLSVRSPRKSIIISLDFEPVFQHIKIMIWDDGKLALWGPAELARIAPGSSTVELLARPWQIRQKRVVGGNLIYPLLRRELRPVHPEPHRHEVHLDNGWRGQLRDGYEGAGPGLGMRREAEIVPWAAAVGWQYCWLEILIPSPQQLRNL